ncbi:hypothetical protein Trydic_g12284 [Trypoxylus dichotomus]
MNETCLTLPTPVTSTAARRHDWSWYNRLLSEMVEANPNIDIELDLEGAVHNTTQRSCQGRSYPPPKVNLNRLRTEIQRDIESESHRTKKWDGFLEKSQEEDPHRLLRIVKKRTGSPFQGYSTVQSAALRTSRKRKHWSRPSPSTSISCRNDPEQESMFKETMDGLTLHILYTDTRAALRTLSGGEDRKEFLDELNGKFFQKAISSDSPANQTAITQKTSGTAKRRTATQTLRKL